MPGGGGGSRVFLALCVLLALSEAEAQDAGGESAPRSAAERAPPHLAPGTPTFRPGVTGPIQGCDRWCPPNAMCANTTACRCKPGFSSSGAEIFTDFMVSCDDINECAPPTKVFCGKFADCQNVVGSYHCTCSPGYAPTSGPKTFQNASENTCEDVDECALGQHQCHNSTHCLNKVGGYECWCRPGWRPVPGSPDGPTDTVCADVDECSSGQHRCHPSTFCVNAVGSYRCRCRPGWRPKPGVPNNQNITVCEETPFTNWTEPPPGIRSQTLSDFFKKVQDLGKAFKPESAKDTIKNLIALVDELLRARGDMDHLAPPMRHRIATYLLSGLEDLLRALAKTLPEEPLTYWSPSGTELSLVIQEQGNKNVTMGQSQARMLLNWAVAAGAGDSGPAVAGVFSSQNMKKLLANASLDLEPEKQARLEETHESPVHGAQVRILSAVNSVFLSNTDTEKLASPITFAFSHKDERPRTREELICAFWKGDSHSGRWATTGCRVLGSGNGSTTCQCSHLSSFAILMAHYDVQDWKLALITKVGLALSLVCLLLCIFTFLLVRPIQGSRTTIHLHLCICLFVGSAIFLAGIENQGDEVGLRCRLVAGLLHYCFLAAFCWMSLEGLELYFLVVRVFQGQGLRTRWLCLIGYGVPLLIVAISAASYSEGYGRTSFCWLSFNRGFLWSFLGPVIFIILCNAVIFVTTVWKLAHKFSEISPDMKKLKKARVLTITAIAQLFVLGCTWVFGLFLFNPHNWVLSYLFSVLNCLQGFFLYLLHCLLNRKVREEYRKWACLIAGNKYSEFASSTTNTSHNQMTRALRPSESGM
ncbi:adhesion G protein-coupled receptor E5 isoform X2 [Microcebus murinus]|uniref:adhesion G protein-coupled receptor E5 isoform X2 n=1 Tax=Microcebus murinus TaxID=30608 RepID=UPI003F6D4EE6